MPAPKWGENPEYVVDAGFLNKFTWGMWSWCVYCLLASRAEGCKGFALFWWARTSKRKGWGSRCLKKAR